MLFRIQGRRAPLAAESEKWAQRSRGDLKIAGIHLEPPIFVYSWTTATAICFAMKKRRMSGAWRDIEQRWWVQFPVSPSLVRSRQAPNGAANFPQADLSGRIGSDLVDRKTEYALKGLPILIMRRRSV